MDKFSEPVWALKVSTLAGNAPYTSVSYVHLMMSHDWSVARPPKICASGWHVWPFRNVRDQRFGWRGLLNEQHSGRLWLVQVRGVVEHGSNGSWAGSDTRGKLAASQIRFVREVKEGERRRIKKTCTLEELRKIFPEIGKSDRIYLDHKLVRVRGAAV